MRYGKSDLVRFAPVVSTSPAYTSGDCVGPLQSRDTGPLGSTLLKNIVITDLDNQKADLTIVFFRSVPAGTFTDNAAFPALSAADLALVCGKVNIAAADYETINTRAIAIKDIASVIQFDPPSPATTSQVGSTQNKIYFAILTTGTPTYTTTSSLGVLLGLLPDE